MLHIGLGQQLSHASAAIAQTCWDKCMGSPGNYLSSREEACFQNCAKRFLETTQLIMQVSTASLLEQQWGLVAACCHVGEAVGQVA